ncbi:MAG: ABC transporter substrate-binding protein [Gemmatimonadetes bacterium]|nr:ABC transporter substrate-binding protein [Gemmatimonadota bacterium]
MSETITLAHSPDPDDAFMFYALARGEIDTEGLDFQTEAADVESLNRRGAAGDAFDVTAFSAAAMPAVAEHYKILDAGSSLGRGFGPIVVAREPRGRDSLEAARFAIPGTNTSAWLALRLALGTTPKHECLPFEAILDAVEAGELDVGLVIHEGQLTYGDHRLNRILDLGRWWTDETGLPLPLGVNAIRRGFDPELETRIARVVSRSIRYGLEQREDALAYAREFGRGISRDRADRFVGMYVNELTVSLGVEGRRAIEIFLAMGYRKGHLPDPSRVEFVAAE